MRQVWKVLRDVVLVFCCLVTLGVGVFLACNFDQVQKIARTLYLIDDKFLGETDAGKLTDGAVRGMLDSLGDRYTSYIDAEALSGFMTEVSGDVYGIGVYTAEDDEGRLVILSPIADSPAEQAGIRAGDILRAIDGVRTDGMTLDEAVARMRGLADTAVEVTVERDGAERTFTVTRFKLGSIQTVHAERLAEDPEIAYVRIYEFSMRTAEEFAEQVNTLVEDGFTGMILDLRDNGGGEVNAAVDVARVFVPEGPIVHVVSADGETETKSATEAQIKVPLAVLVNGNTASAAEILAAALQESGVATLVGTQTFGKGLVQGVYLYGDGTAMKITEAKYLTPLRNDIHGVGIRPDVLVELPEGAETDLQLERAVSLLQAAR